MKRKDFPRDIYNEALRLIISSALSDSDLARIKPFFPTNLSEIAATRILQIDIAMLRKALNLPSEPKEKFKYDKFSWPLLKACDMAEFIIYNQLKNKKLCLYTGH